jgi:hypothetical protein
MLPQSNTGKKLWNRTERRPNGCLIFTGATNGRYGVVSWGGRNMYAHRLAFLVTYGYLPVQVCHDCPDGDEPLCIEPTHLFAGDSAINHADMVQKRRHTYGERDAMARLLEEDVRNIYERATKQRGDGGMSHKALADEYGIDDGTVNLIIKGINWRHLGLAPVKRDLRGQPSLTDEQARTVFARYHAGEKQRDLAHEFGIGQSQVSNIVTGKTYRDLGLVNTGSGDPS